MAYELYNAAIEVDTLYTTLFNALPGSSILLKTDAPRYTIIAVTPRYLIDTGTQEKDMIGKGLFESSSIRNTDSNYTGDRDDLQSSLEYVLKNKLRHSLPLQQYSPQNGNDNIVRYWKKTNNPVLTTEGDVAYIIHTIEDVTSQVLADQKAALSDSIEKIYNLFVNAPVIIGLVRGDDHIIEIANNRLLEVWGRTAEVIGKPVLEAIPELAVQGYKALLDNVLISGESFYAYEFPTTFTHNGKEELFYFDFVYKPLYDKRVKDKPSGVICIAHDVTTQVLARKKIEESEAKYRTLFNTMDQGFCVLEMIFDDNNQPINYCFLETNPVFEKQTGLKDAIGKTVLQLVPDLEVHWFERYGEVALSGKSIRFIEESEAMGHWYEVYAFKLGNEESRKVALLFSNITEQRKAEQEIRESEARFRNLADDSPMFVFIINPDLEASVSYWNKMWLQYTGQSSEEALGSRAWDGVIHPDDVAIVKEYHTLAFENKRSYFIPAVRVKRFDGTYRWHAFKANPRYLSNGDFNGYIGVGFDIHEQKLTEEALKQSETRYRLAVTSAELGTFDVDLLTNELIASERMQSIFGVEAIHDHDYYINALHPNDKNIRDKAYKAAYQNGLLEYEARIIRKDKTLRWIRVKGRVFFNNTLIPIKLVGVVQDITEEKEFAEQLRTQVDQRTAELLKAHEALLDTNTYYQYIINQFDAALAALVPVYEGDKIVDFEFKMTNEAFSIYSNLSPSAIQGKRVSAIFPEYYKTDTFERYVKVFESGVLQKWELHYNVDGLNIFLLVVASKMNEEVVVNFTNFTELKGLQLDLLRKIEELRRSNANLEEFAHAASHDMKEPIRKVLTFADRLKQSLGSRMTAFEAQLFERMEISTKRMGLLVDDLLEFSHVSERPMQMETVNLNIKLQKVLSDLELLIEEKGAIIKADPLPVIKGYKRQLQQLLQNLLGNALKYSKSDTVPVISVKTRIVKGSEVLNRILPEQEMESFHLIEVSDNGIGFEQQYAERIFGMFQRLHGKAEYAGTGVGLSIVRKVVENHNGYIWAEGKPGQGATFSLLLLP